MADSPKILYCHCARARVVPDGTKKAVLQGLCDAGVAFDSVPDLCEMAARRDPGLQRLASGGRIHVVACHARAVKGLFRVADATLPDDAVVLDMRSRSAEEIVAALPAGQEPRTDAAGRAAKLESPAGTWPAWFPVIDYERCTHCMQCLSFCLFGVFAASKERRLVVVNPESCKPGCPACARVCPEVAIIFPKYAAGPINGDEVRGDEAGTEKVKVDISALLGGNVYESLRARSQARFSRERHPALALAERQKWLNKMQQELHIPPEVLQSAPPPEEILRRAMEARAAARPPMNGETT